MVVFVGLGLDLVVFTDVASVVLAPAVFFSVVVESAVVVVGPKIKVLLLELDTQLTYDPC